MQFLVYHKRHASQPLFENKLKCCCEWKKKKLNRKQKGWKRKRSLFWCCYVFFTIAIAAREIFRCWNRNRKRNGKSRGCPCVCVKRVICSSKVKSSRICFSFSSLAAFGLRSASDPHFSSLVRLLKASENSDFDNAIWSLAVASIYLNWDNWKRDEGGKRIIKDHIFTSSMTLSTVILGLGMITEIRYEPLWIDGLDGHCASCKNFRPSRDDQPWRRRWRAPERARNARRRRDADAGCAERRNVF